MTEPLAAQQTTKILRPRTVRGGVDDKIALRALLEKGSDATFLREMIGFAAQRLMELEVKRCAAPGMASAVRSGATSATAPATGRRVRVQSSCASRSCGDIAAWPRRRSRGTTKIDTQTRPNDVRYDRRHKREGGGTWGAGLLYSTLLSRWSAAVFLPAAPNRHNSPRRSLCCRLPRWSAVPRLRVKRGRRP